MQNRAIVLIEVIIIIIALAIVALGIATYVSEGLRYNISNINQDKALYLAQAGIMQAVATYINTGSWSAMRNVNVAEGLYYHVGGGSADFLLVDASGPIAVNKEFYAVPIKNISLNSAITITNMIVIWNFGGNILKVRLGGSWVWNIPVASPANLDIMDFTIPAGTEYASYSHQDWAFSKQIPAGLSITVTFIFSDGTSRKVVLAQNQRAGNKEFSIKATGEVRSGSKVEARRTLIATYDTNTSTITSWEETQDHIIP
ncbi:MAG TPA: hypothetical protein PLC32_06885 [Candidatus Omnitrophota bacterium]|nr:hypothetical protein [Candidatus Omnitrophota bacterium]